MAAVIAGVGILGKIVVEITKPVVKPVGRQIGYLVHSKENIEKLEDEFEKLGDDSTRVQGRVDRGRQNGEIIENDIWKWLMRVHGVKAEVGEFLEDETVNVDKRCFKGCCPDVRSRYRLGKEAKKKMMLLVRLKQEGEFDTVGHCAPPPEIGFTSGTDYDHFESRASVFKEIMEAMVDDAINTIGISGMGGVGKTTMVEEIGKQVQKDLLFDEVVIAVVSQNVDVTRIQGELADRLNLNLDAQTEVGRANQLCNRLKNGKRILVIIDDIWKEINLKEIGIPFTDGVKGCKIVLTSRNRSVFLEMNVQKHFLVRVLSEQESWTLFKKKVGNFIESPEIRSVAEKVCRECNGLPVAILAVGAALMKYKNRYAWEDALEQLSKSRLKKIEGLEERLSSSLELSYDYLEPADAKPCFLLCCIFPEDAEISVDDLLIYGVGMGLFRDAVTLKNARDRVRVLVDKLKTSCLLLQCRDENRVKMHDVIRDVAISIASKEKRAVLVKNGVQEWPDKHEYESCTAISLLSMNIQELPDDLECPQLRILTLQCDNHSLKVPDNLFKGMEKLEVLKLTDLSVPSSVSNLVNLQVLCLTRCKLADISLLKELKKLEILSFDGSGIKELAPDIRQLTRLRQLDLRNCNELTVIPPNVISSLTRLEELYIPHRFDKWEVEATNKERSNMSLVELDALNRLTALELHIPNVTVLPKKLLFEKLIRFKISIGCRRFGYGDSLLARAMKFTGIPLKDELTVLLHRAEVLYLNELQGLENVLRDRDGDKFLDLKYLEVEKCESIRQLLGKLTPLGSMCKLTVLKVGNCRMKYLFCLSIVRGLVQLQHLEIKECEIVEEIVGDEEEVTDMVVFPKLKIMALEYLPNLRSFYPKMKKKSRKEENLDIPAQPLFNEKIAFPALEKLIIERLEKMREIWDNQLSRLPPVLRVSEELEKSFSQLRVLEVKQCGKLVNVVPSNMLPRLQNLEELSVGECNNIATILSLTVEGLNVEDKGRSAATLTTAAAVLPRLRKLKLSYLPELMHTGLNNKEYSHGIKGFSALTSLHICECGSLRNVFSPRILVHLKDLRIEKCPKMEEIVAAAANDDIIVIFPQLKELELQELPNLKSFYSSRSEEKQRVGELNPRHHLFNHKIAFPALERLEINEVDQIREIWDNQLVFPVPQEAEEEEKSFCQLRELLVWSCLKLVNAIPSYMLPRLQNLEEVYVRHCKSMISIVEGLNIVENEGLAAAATTITTPLLFPPRLRILALGSLPKLVHTGLNNKEYSHHGIKGYSGLTHLSIWRCSSLRNVISPSIARSLVHLQSLTISYCPKMEEIIAVAAETEEEEEVNDDIIIFPQLTSLRLRDLPSLKTFRPSSRSKVEEEEEKMEEEEDTPRAQALFNHKVSFPALEKLTLGVNSREICFGHLPVESFCKLELNYCNKLSTVVSPNLLQRLQHLEELSVENCSKVRVVFDLEGLNVGKGQVELLSRLKLLELKFLPELNCLWNKEPLGIMSFRSLEMVRIEKCDLLRYLFSSSVAIILEGLQTLEIKSCKVMEEIVANKGGEVTGKIVLPKLKSLVLAHLPNLSSFCSANYAFNMPSLKKVRLYGCPKMQTFTFGQASMPKIKLYEIEHQWYWKKDQWLWIEDLNKYVQQHVLKGKGLTEYDNANDDEEEDQSGDEVP
uniref:Uncharacterized protein n=1 Tax=Davidia involucrata TaxID=16924 RepID=A0A5B7A010_DAVIN